MSIKFELPKLREGEKIEIFLRKHSMFLIIPLSVILIIIIMPVIFVFYLIISTSFFNQPPVKNLLIIIISSYSLIMCGYGLYTWFRYYFSFLIVTNERLIEIEQKGLFNRNTSELELIRIEDVKALIHGVLATFFHYGDVLVETAGATSENFLFEKIPHASYVSTKILELSQRALEEQQPETGGRMASVLLEGKNKNKFFQKPQLSKDDLSSSQTIDSYHQDLKKDDFENNLEINNFNKKEELKRENEVNNENFTNKSKGGILYERDKNNNQEKNSAGGVDLE